MFTKECTLSGVVCSCHVIHEAENSAKINRSNKVRLKTKMAVINKRV